MMQANLKLQSFRSAKNQSTEKSEAKYKTFRDNPHSNTKINAVSSTNRKITFKDDVKESPSVEPITTAATKNLL